MRLIAHSLVKNESRWIWYSLMSVIDLVDEIMVWDDSSTDNTAQIIKSISSPKIKYQLVRLSSPEDHSRIRQQMIDQTKADWILILDGDEVRSQSLAGEIRQALSPDSGCDYLISRFYNCIGDVYHYQEEAAGRYEIKGLVGNYTIRFINLNSFPGLRVARPHGQQGFVNTEGRLIQDIPGVKYKILSTPYLHMTHLRRSTQSQDSLVQKRHFKFKFELGDAFPADYKYPEVFYAPRPHFVISPWVERNWFYYLNSAWQTPLKKLRRRVVPYLKSGYIFIINFALASISLSELVYL